uniref:Uncharacterized protein n=1 Tax=Mycena chlorophos TaxID=658473 RepID=A0ABQ0LN66_MYCCL|nr:predicted protein [Mycena chlorophos]
MLADPLDAPSSACVFRFGLEPLDLIRGPSGVLRMRPMSCLGRKSSSTSAPAPARPAAQTLRAIPATLAWVDACCHDHASPSPRNIAPPFIVPEGRRCFGSESSYVDRMSSAAISNTWVEWVNIVVARKNAKTELRHSRDVGLVRIASFAHF